MTTVDRADSLAHHLHARNTAAAHGQGWLAQALVNCDQAMGRHHDRDAAAAILFAQLCDQARRCGDLESQLDWARQDMRTQRAWAAYGRRVHTRDTLRVHRLTRAARLSFAVGPLVAVAALLSRAAQRPAAFAVAAAALAFGWWLRATARHAGRLTATGDPAEPPEQTDGWPECDDPRPRPRGLRRLRGPLLAFALLLACCAGWLAVVR